MHGAGFQEGTELGFVKHGDAEFFGLGGLGAGVFADDDPIGFLADRAGSLAAALDDGLLGGITRESLQRTSHDDGLSGKRLRQRAGLGGGDPDAGRLPGAQRLDRKSVV